MRRYLLFLLLASPASATISVIQHASTSSNSATVLTKAYTSPLGSAHLLIAVAGCAAGHNCDTGAVTSTNNTWTKALSINHGLQVNIYFSCNSVAGSDTVTLTSTGAFDMHLHIYEVSGIKTVSCTDQSGTATPNGGTTFTATTSGSVGQSDELLFGGVSDNDFPPPSPISGTGTWTTLENTVTTNYTMASMTSSVTTGLSGTQSVTASVGVAPVFWSGAILTFFGAPAASGSDLSPIVISKEIKHERQILCKRSS